MFKTRFRTDILPLKDMLFRLALRITQSREEAEDIVQETMLKVWDRREQWEHIENLEAFTTTTCRNLALDHQKRLDRQHASLDDPSTPLSAASALQRSPLDQAVSHDRIDLVRRLIDALPEKQRSCVQLRDIEGKSYRDIALALQITEEQVKVNIFRARQTIRRRFQQLDDYQGNL